MPTATPKDLTGKQPGAGLGSKTELNMHCKDFYFRHLDLSVGDTVYYVTGYEAIYSIKKTRIAIKESRHQGLEKRFWIEYTVYVTEDGTIISRDFKHKMDEISSEQVYLSKAEAIQFIKDRLHQEINLQRNVLLNAQERLAAAERVLKNYEKQSTITTLMQSRPTD